MDTLETQLASRPRHISPEEWSVRVDLAACYRLIAHFGWDDLVLTHNSARVPGTTDQMLINPAGLMFDEITASRLVKVNTAGQVVDGSGARVNPSGFAIHGAVHAARPDVECVIHLHTPWGVALTMLPQGLQPTSQWAMRLYGRLGRHAYEGLALGADEQQRLVGKLGTLDGLLAQACAVGTEARVDAYRERLARVTSLRELLDLGRTLHEEERAAGNVTVLAQMLAGAQGDPELAEPVGQALGLYGPNDAAGFFMSLLGAILLLAIYRMATGRRRVVTP